MTKFPQTIAAVQRRDRSLWEIGDALLAECGAPSADGVRDGSHAELLAVADEIEGLKIEGYSLRYLTKLRSVSSIFSPARRAVVISWDAHCAAGSPEMLEAIVKVAPKQKGQPKVSRDYVREMRDAIENQQSERYREEHEERDDTRPMPPRKPTLTEAKQAASQVAITQSLHKIMALIAQAENAEKTARELLEESLTVFVPEAYDAMVEQALVVSNRWREFSTAAGRTQRNKRGHLSVVNE